MTEKYCIENDFIAQKELAEIERYNSLLIWEENKSLRASVARLEEAIGKIQAELAINDDADLCIFLAREALAKLEEK